MPSFSYKNMFKKTIELYLHPMNPPQTTKINIHYTKLKPVDLKYLEEHYECSELDAENEYNPFRIVEFQNYNPIYAHYFELNEKNFNRIGLNHPYHFVDCQTVHSYSKNETISRPIHIKFSPLLDPIKFMIGKYDMSDPSFKSLPKLGDDKSCAKIRDFNNTSYVDNFFSYLTGQMLNERGFRHGVDYYGSFLGIQEKYKMDIEDDFEYLQSSEQFHANRNRFFTVARMPENVEQFGIGSRANRQRLQFSSSSRESIEMIEEVVLLDSSESLSPPDSSSELEEVYKKEETASESSASSDDSSLDDTASETDDEDDDDEDDDGAEEEWETESDCDDESDYSTGENEGPVAFLNNFPMQMICLEKCDGTLDELFENEELDDAMGISALFQIIMTLITYQNAFQFTHNDLHTNNVMFVKTQSKYLYYKYKGVYYRVPTYGRIFKLIDFGRAIYKYGGNQYCSDSFAPGGDAATQYNCEPFMNPNKARLEPNYSFDLCRLGTSIHDFIIDDHTMPVDTMSNLQKIVARWCLDDNGKNVLYKRNGEERYPDFKLYKMIARTVHRHIPEAQLSDPIFNSFSVPSKDVVYNEVMDMDAM
jgi:hypothetical protein